MTAPLELRRPKTAATAAAQTHRRLAQRRRPLAAPAPAAESSHRRACVTGSPSSPASSGAASSALVTTPTTTALQSGRSQLPVAASRGSIGSAKSISATRSTSLASLSLSASRSANTTAGHPQRAAANPATSNSRLRQATLFARRHQQYHITASIRQQQQAAPTSCSGSHSSRAVNCCLCRPTQSRSSTLGARRPAAARRDASSQQPATTTPPAPPTAARQTKSSLSASAASLAVVKRPRPSSRGSQSTYQQHRASTDSSYSSLSGSSANNSPTSQRRRSSSSSSGVGLETSQSCEPAIQPVEGLLVNQSSVGANRARSGAAIGASCQRPHNSSSGSSSNSSSNSNTDADTNTALATAKSEDPPTTREQINKQSDAAAALLARKQTKAQMNFIGNQRKSIELPATTTILVVDKDSTPQLAGDNILSQPKLAITADADNSDHQKEINCKKLNPLIAVAKFDSAGDSNEEASRDDIHSNRILVDASNYVNGRIELLGDSDNRDSKGVVSLQALEANSNARQPRKSSVTTTVMISGEINESPTCAAATDTAQASPMELAPQTSNGVFVPTPKANIMTSTPSVKSLPLGLHQSINIEPSPGQTQQHHHPRAPITADATNKPPRDVTIRTEPIGDFYYIETRPFARGKFAQVKRCIQRESKECFAAKCIKKRRRLVDIRHEILLEIEALKLSHLTDHIVKLYEVFETPTEMILILEMADGGELQRVIDDEEAIEEQVVKRMVRQILEGLVHLHDNQIAHLDIKPQNLLLTKSYPDGDIKLCDFGISRRITKDCEIREICGTPDYVAPEILRYDPIGLATDMWSLGVLTYVLLSGYSPFGSENKQQTFCNITQATLDFPSEIFDKISDEAIDFMQKLIVQEPTSRLTSREARDHPWLNQ